MKHATCAVALLLSLLAVPFSSGGGSLGATAFAVGHGGVWVGTGGGSVWRLPASRTTLGAPVRWLQPGGFRVSTFVHGLEAAFGSVWVADGTGGRLVRLDPRRRFRPVEVRKQGLWHPTHLAIAAGAVWVGDSGARTVYRVDRRTNRAVRSFRLPGDVMKLVGSGESVWVVTAGPGWRIAPIGPRFFHRIDPRTNRVSSFRRVGCDPLIAATGETLWLADGCSGTTLRRISSSTGSEQAIELPARPSSLALGYGSLWVTAGSSTLRLDLASMRVIATLPAKGSIARVAGGSVWLLECWGCTRTRLLRINPRTNTVTAQPLRLPQGQ